MTLRRNRKVFVVAAAVIAVLFVLTLIGLWGSYSTQQSVLRAQRARNLARLHVALAYYANKHHEFPPLCTADDAGRPLQSWRVHLLPFLDQNALFSQIDLNASWDSPGNRRLLEMMPEYYRSPMEVNSQSTTTNYFAVVGPHSPWRSAKDTKSNTSSGADAIEIIEVIGSKTPWMDPRDPTIEELLDMIFVDSDESDGGSRAIDIMYITVYGEVGTVDRKIDRASLRKLLLGEEKLK